MPTQSQDSEWEDVPAQATPSASDEWEDVAAPSKSPSLGRRALEGAGRALDYGGGLSRVALSQSAPAQMADLLQSYLRNKPMVSGGIGDWKRALAGDAPRSAEFMDRAGIPEGGALSDVIPGAYTSTPEEANSFWRAKLAKGGLFDPTARGTAGTIADIATDPLSYTGLTALSKGGGMLSRISNGLKRIAAPLETSEDALRSGALSATKSHLRPTPRVAQAIGPEKMNDIAAEVLDSGAMKPFSKAEKTAANLDPLKQESGAVIEDAINASHGQVKPQEIADRFDKEVIDPLRSTAENEPLVAQLEKQKEQFLEHYADKNLTPAQVEAEKRAVQDNINYLIDPKAKQSAQRGWGSLLRDQTERMVPDEGFKAAKRAYGNQAAAQDMLDRTAALTDGGKGLMGHMTDVGVGHAALESLIHGHAAGIPLVAARYLSKGKMSSLTANALNQLSKLAGSKYAPAIDALIRRKEINSLAPPSPNPWQNALQSQSNGGNQ